jgi:[histone H3]-trimethyl-L-lysine9/36 demethylase
MDASAGSWNMNNLDSILKYALTEKVKGVTEPYCYIGCWKAFFSWHKEDLDLGAINYIHEGASKFWYAISPDHAHILEQESKEFFKAQARQCP